MICGGGPVGLALALALARYDIPSVVVEADASVCDGSRAICLSRRSLEILDRLGVLKPFLEKGLGWTVGRSYYQTAEILRFEMPHGPDQRLLPMTNLQQFYIEQFLVDAVEKRRDLIELRWSTTFKHLERRDDHVMATLQAANTTYQTQANWLVGCDGARSAVRQDLGLRMSGTAYEGRYVIVDIEIDLDLPTERLAWFDPPSNPGRTMLMHRQPDNVWRLDYQLHEGEDADEMIRPENVVPRVEAHLKMLGIDQPYKLLWTSTYRASALSLDAYVHGRVLFAGDAAHLVPIFGVRGLNGGFDDIFNLAWKLASVMSGRSPATLLDSYSQERHLAWRTNIAHAMKSTEFMAPPSKGFRLMRDAVLSLAATHPELRSLINPRQSSAITYSDSGLNSVTADEPLFAHGPKVGEIIPECRLLDESGATRFLTQELGRHFSLLVFDNTGSAHRELIDGSQSGDPLAFICIVAPGRRAPAQDMPGDVLIDDNGRSHDLFDASPIALYLVRPDGHVCARWKSYDLIAVQAALEKAAGRRSAM